MGILVSFPLGACTSHHTGGGLVSPAGGGQWEEGRDLLMGGGREG